MGTSLSETVREALGPETTLIALSSTVRADRAIAAVHLKQHLEDPAYRAALVEFLQRESSPSPLFLDALSTIEAVRNVPICEQLFSLLDVGDVAIRKHAARVIALCFSPRCRDLGPRFTDSDIRYECCFSGDEATAESMLQWYLNQQRTPDIAFGLLLTPEILCRLASRFPAAATDLAVRFGYLEGLDFEGAAPLLECGFWSVPDGIALGDQARLGVRTAEIESTLLTILLGRGGQAIEPLDLSSPVDVAALCGAVRSLDHQFLTEHKFENRLQVRSLDNVRRALCKHAPLSFCRKILISDALGDAERLGVPQSHWGHFVLEHAATVVTHDTDLRVERLMYLKSRWAQRPDRSAVIPSQWTFPVLCDADAPELKYRILSPRQWSRTKSYLEAPSPGALAAARLLQVIGREDLIADLFAFERACERQFPACGIELQLMLSSRREQESLAWKQTLRALGIPSPRRPDYRSMVEVSFPPSRSYLPQVLVTLLLDRLGLFIEPADLALHQSFSGDLGCEVRYLLFAQQFLTEPRVRSGALRLARLMSKGFAHLNHDAIPLDGIVHGGVRTELRSYRFGYRGASEAEPLQRQFIDDIIETSLLIAAKVSLEPALREVWDSYCRGVTEIAMRYPPVVSELLQADWYECTGEPRDEEFVLRLPIVQAWVAVRQWTREHGTEGELRQTFRELRSSHATRVAKQLNLNPLMLGQDCVLSRSGAPYLEPVPADLAE